MNSKKLICIGKILGTAILAGLTLASTSTWAQNSNVHFFAGGLNNPRGLKFGPDGNLYVAEGGAGGTTSTVGQCEQVPAPVGPYTGGFTARISKIDKFGNRTTVVDKLPSSQTAPTQGSLVSGVGDVAFVGSTLYAILSGAGCSHGLAGTSNALIRVNPNGTWTMVANLSDYLKAHPAANPDLVDFEPDGTWYSMVSVRGKLYAVEPNHQEIDSIEPATGEIHRIIDLSITHPVWFGPTTIAYHGNFYVGNLTPFPLVSGAAKVIRITPSGQVHTDASGSRW